MFVYTFSTGGCRDDIYLNNLSLTLEGVKDNIKYYLVDSYIIDEREIITDILIHHSLITVIIYDLDLKRSSKKYLELVSFTVS